MAKIKKTVGKVSVNTGKKGRVYTIEGNDYTSVTTPLGIVSFPYLEVWRARVGKTKADRVGAKAGRRGTLIHDYCDKVCTGEEYKCKKAHQDTMDAFEEWFHRRVKKVWSTEQVVFSKKHKVAGRYDFFGELKGDGLFLIDWKTGRIKKESYLQLAAYCNLLAECTDVNLPDIDGRMTLSVKDKVKEYTPNKGKDSTASIKKDFNMYLNILKVWKWANNK